MKTSRISDSRYLLPENLSKKQFLDRLGHAFVLKKIKHFNENFSLLDSFEWGVYQRRRLAIAHENHSITIWDEAHLFDQDSKLHIDDNCAEARFWWDFPDGEIQQFLAPTLKLRSLNPVYSGILKTEQIHLQNNSGKILLFAQLISIYKPEQPRTALIRQIHLSPIAGYQKEYAQACKLLEQLGAYKASQAPLDSLLSAIGLIPQEYTIKPQIDIPPNMPARAAVSSIIATMIAKQRLNEHGVIHDIDSEFLHHFRVAIRMVRAAIAQLKEVFPQQDVSSLKKRFGDLARETNKLRDLDVFILDKQRYMQLLPESMRTGIIPMFDDFQQRRASEAKRISHWMTSKSYRHEIDALQGLFQQGYCAMETLWSEQPSIELATTKIQKTYNKIHKAAIKITPDTADEKIHEIRIDCKKLRYLLYFFGSQFDAKKVKVFAKHLKSLQDSLGIFNDLTVQGQFLSHYLQQIEHQAAGKDTLLIASLGGLIAALHAMQLQERKRCIEQLAHFSNDSNRQLFQQTFINPLQEQGADNRNRQQTEQSKGHKKP